MESVSKLIKLVLPFFILGCSSGSEKGDLILKELTSSLENSNIRIERSTESMLRELNDKLTDPAVSEKAKIYEPKARVVCSTIKKVYEYINVLKSDLQNNIPVNKLIFDNQKGDELYNKLINCKRELFAADSELKVEFDRSIILTSESFDAGKTKKTFANYFFENVSFSQAIALLSKFQNNLKVLENRIVSYYINKPSDGCLLTFSIYSAIIGQSSNIVKPGDDFKITAGVGAFSKAALPQILMNNKRIEVDEKAVAVLEFKAPNLPGKYKVPVKINFIDQDGQKREITETIEYTVSNCGN